MILIKGIKIPYPTINDGLRKKKLDEYSGIICVLLLDDNSYFYVGNQ